MSLLELPFDTVHLWCALTGEHDSAMAEPFALWMSEDERARYERFRLPRDKHQYLATRVLVRTTLSSYAAVPPAAWRFTANQHGRPEIYEPSGVEWLRFNLTNTNGLVACAVIRDGDVGVDAEDITRAGDAASLARRFFAPKEFADFQRAPDAATQRERFAAYWTLKEAYLKARGIGLSVPLEQIAFVLSDDMRDARIEADLSVSDGAESEWQFALLKATDRHLIALATKGTTRRSFGVHVRQGFPSPNGISQTDLGVPRPFGSGVL
jgi:4'-phosphopantetheinyl transferase